MAERRPLRIAVVGGGIAGLSTACGLLQAKANGANIELDVYEAASKFGEIGAGVAFGPNAQRALRMLGLGSVVSALAQCPERTKDMWFEVRVGEKGHPEEDRVIDHIEHTDAGRGGVHRADFLDYLINKIPKDVSHFRKRCIEYDASPSAATLYFDDGTTAEADVIVACDGIKSLVRRAMYKKLGIEEAKQAAKYAEWIAWRGLISAEVYKAATGGLDPAMPMLWVGPDKHILNFPVKNGAVVNIVAFVHDVQHKKLGDHTGPWSEPRPKEEMLEDYAGFNDVCLNLLKAIPNPSIWGIFDIPLLPVSIAERIVLVGDAAHATTPHQGSGAGMAVEDALFLTRLLTDPKTCDDPTGPKIQSALEIYTSFRHDRAAKVQKTSAEAGLLYEFNGVGGEGRNPDRITENMKDRMLWIWNWETETQLKAAVGKLR